MFRLPVRLLNEAVINERENSKRACQDFGQRLVHDCDCQSFERRDKFGQRGQYAPYHSGDVSPVVRVGYPSFVHRELGVYNPVSNGEECGHNSRSSRNDQSGGILAHAAEKRCDKQDELRVDVGAEERR